MYLAKNLFPMSAASDLDPLRAERLLRKYRELLSLRLEREDAVHRGLDRFPGEQARTRRQRLHFLALEFPGSLRELDLRHAKTLQERIHALEATHLKRAPEPAWASAVDTFHRRLREALAIKRWLARHLPRGGPIAEHLVHQFEVEHPERTRRLSADELQRYLNPEGGRLLGMVWSELEHELGRTHRELEHDVYG